MDWKRAKTIFLCAFLLLDLFLSVQIYQMYVQKSNYVNTDEITDEQIRELLETNQVKMTAKKPEQITKIPALRAAITPISGWTYDDKWNYHKTFNPPLTAQNRQDVAKIAKQQLSFFGVYQYAEEYSKPQQTTFVQYSEKHPIFDAEITGTLQAGKLKQLQALHFQLKEKVPIEFISFNHALYNLLTREELPKNATLSHVELGYRSMYYPNPKEVILVPVWRFTVNERQYYIYATTNSLQENNTWTK